MHEEIVREVLGRTPLLVSYQNFRFVSLVLNNMSKIFLVYNYVKKKNFEMARKQK